jgi:copper(I)-binding protein
MKRIVAVAAALCLAGCHYSETASEKITSDGAVTHIVKSTNVNGVQSKIELEVTRFAMRTPPNGQTTTAAYFTVTNKGSSADRLTGVSCACAQSAMLHTTTHDNGMTGMAKAEAFPLPAGQSLVFAPGGNHVMLMGVTAGLKEGDYVDLVLTFAKAGPVTLHMPVRDAPLRNDSSDAMSGMKM